MQYTDIRFPNLGVIIPHVGRYIQLGNFQIMYYGIVIAIAFILGLFVTQREAKRTGQDTELYVDYFLYMIIPAIVGARMYYVIFSWDYYKNHLWEIINIRNGGLGIVGGVTLAFLTLCIFCKKRKYSIFKMTDTIIMGLLIGQILGRWGNFFNREAFGGYTNGLFAMQIPLPYFAQNNRLGELQASGILDHLVSLEQNGQMISYIQVHPTFLYEGLWNLLILCLIFFYRKRKKFDGELTYIYFIGYGIGRFFIESLRVDQLTIGSTGIAATQVVCILLIMIGIAGIWRGRREVRRVAYKE